MSSCEKINFGVSCQRYSILSVQNVAKVHHLIYGFNNPRTSIMLISFQVGNCNVLNVTLCSCSGLFPAPLSMVTRDMAILILLLSVRFQLTWWTFRIIRRNVITFPDFHRCILIFCILSPIFIL